MRILKGHGEDVVAVTYSPDGRTLATGSLDRTVRLWDLASGTEKTAPLKHPGGVHTVAFSPDGRLLASGGGSMTLRLWDAVLGIKLCNLSGHTAVVKCVAWSPDGHWLVSGAGDRSLSTHRHGQAILWDRQRQEGYNRPVWSASHGVLSVALRPDGRLLALGTGNHEIALWDCDQRQPLGVLKQTVVVRSLAFSPDGRTLVSAAHRRILFWDVERQAPQAALEGHEDRVCAVVFTPDGRQLISGSWDGTVRLWDVEARRQRAAYDWRIGKIAALALAPDGMTAAAAGSDAQVAVWDLE